MKRFKRILATTDFSAESLSTVRYAAHLAKSQGAKLTILHVPQSTSLMLLPYGVPMDVAAIDREIEASAWKRLDALAKRYGKGGVPTQVVVRQGKADEMICQVAAEIDASVIVMATHGRKGLGHALIGSVTERVVREAPCPVLVVRPPAPVIHAKKAA